MADNILSRASIRDSSESERDFTGTSLDKWHSGHFFGNRFRECSNVVKCLESFDVAAIYLFKPEPGPESFWIENRRCSRFFIFYLELFSRALLAQLPTRKPERFIPRRALVLFLWQNFGATIFLSRSPVNMFLPPTKQLAREKCEFH